MVNAKRIMVAMSGGVDSSVTAALCLRQGFEVIGVTMRLYSHENPTIKGKTCCAGKDIYDAEKVARSLNIPHYVMDYEDTFLKEVIESFKSAYLQGETPNPCIECNRTVKFRDLLKLAQDLGACGLATGHYVQGKDGALGPELHTGIDPSKDQSYFLFATRPEQLARLHFPLGGLSKSETREIAAQLGLNVANKPESQDICFVPSGKYSDLLADNARPGKIVTSQGKVLGQHKGIANFTVGQRKGLGIAAPQPLFVLRLDVENNQVIVGYKAELGQESLVIRDVNWLGPDNLRNHDGINLRVKLRSTRPAAAAKLYWLENNQAKIILDIPDEAVAPGQACVFYNGTQVWGGGWICKPENK